MKKNPLNFSKNTYSKLIVLMLCCLFTISNSTISLCAVSKVKYMTAEEFVQKVFVDLKIINHSQDSWNKAKLLKVLPANLKKNSVITKAQAAYILWSTIQNAESLKQRLLPVQTNILSCWEYYKQTGKGFITKNTPTEIALLHYNFVVVEKIYKDGYKKYVLVWNPYTKVRSQDDYVKLVRDFINKNPQKHKVELKENPKTLSVDYIKKVFPIVGKLNNLPPTILNKVYQSVYQNTYQDIENIVLNQLYTVNEQVYCYFSEDKILKVAKIQNFKTSFLGKEYNVNVKTDPRWNKYVEDYIMSLKRDFPVNHERFKYIVADIYLTPVDFQESILRLLDLGLLIPEINPYDQRFYIYPNKKLSSTEVNEIINRISKNENLSFDEFKVDNTFFRIDNLRFLKMLKSLPLKTQSKLKFTSNLFGIDEFGIYIIVEGTKYYLAETLPKNGNMFYYIKPYITYAKTKLQYKDLIPKDQIIEVLSEVDGIYLVKYRNSELWVPSRYLTILPQRKVFLNPLTKEEVEKFVNSQLKNEKSNYFIWVDLWRLSIYLLKKENNEYFLIKTIDCSAGAEYTPTLRGYFKSKAKVYKFYNEHYRAGAMYALVYSGNYMIHSVITNREGKIVDNSIIKRNSHGCIRVPMNDAKYIYDHVPVGSVVWVN
ncbi:ErfK/YbiS/YcfS/YnhG family protein [Caldicellulosiruptor obsidiansis OB47]|uniref:ErfK/YbiS/YcfS/YnhG family protein n=1 Tax=Caldicellulosiruptor obsidiansis (strain ATCC BAA-2073 / JCM 16842 / OB47) TaxID=608506 RepID=D9TJ04_CALOO|nr:L,D-transpeptidase [Caldicellulosiruptor obsidiansis]ADL41986.1 ErfK/YbiS/YcfS/YnhG family protein [Caldicellulosiruptor obsidiansis OB47]